ncbi:MAG: MarR family transcriptional regulator, partial [Archaeoglobaceae archaeon]
MDAEKMILELTKESKSDGVLQSQISEKLKISKSTVSELISKLESEKMVVRKLVSGKAFRVWHVEYAPFPIKGLIRVGILKASEYPKVVSAVEKLKGILKIY